MKAIILARNINKVHNLKTTVAEFSNKIMNFFSESNLLPMERIEKILTADRDIEKKILALRCEVTEIEAKILDNFLIERLERENRELEEEIQKYKTELILLEKQNGRSQLNGTESMVHTKPVEIKIENTIKTPVAEKLNCSEAVSNTNISKTSQINKKTKKEANKSNVDNKKSGTGPVEEPPVDIGRLDLRVGKILQIAKHPDADSLYVEKVDIGKQEPITVVSGLVKHIAASDMLNSLVIILCNLKPAKMRGITSEGMVMCASSEGVVEVLRPPSDCLPGEAVTCPGYTSNPDSVLNPKKKIFETVAPDLKTDSEMEATYKSSKWTVGSKGGIKAQTLKGANIK